MENNHSSHETRLTEPAAVAPARMRARKDSEGLGNSRVHATKRASLRVTLTICLSCPTTSVVQNLLQAVRDELRSRVLPSGGWSYLVEGRIAEIEPTCLAALALRTESDSTGLKALLGSQRHDGGWGAFPGDEESCGLTGLALLVLNAFGTGGPSALRAVDWLLDTEGREAHWVWKWKFRTIDRHVRFNPARFGWPWQIGTCSWVVPTAFSLLALQQNCPRFRQAHVGRRIELGVQMLLDRACPGGGWNAGNGIVYGASMSPHVDATAIALLALRSECPNETTARSLRWLEGQASACSAPWSLAWTIIALDAYGRTVESLQQRLGGFIKAAEVDDTATLATVALALDCTTVGNAFEVWS